MPKGRKEKIMNKQQKNAIFNHVYDAVFYGEYGIDNPSFEIEMARRKGFPEDLLQEAIKRAKAAARMIRTGKY